MRVFLDFEASSLGKNGYPIEVGWVFEDGRPEAHLIKPAEGWTDWDKEAEAIHGLSRERLTEEGAPAETVARRLVEALTGHLLYASAPSWDGKWLSKLLRGGGLPRHALRLRDSEEARDEAVRERLEGVLPPAELDAVVSTILAGAAERARRREARHRALADAEGERQIWLEVQRLADQERERRGGRPFDDPAAGE